MPSNSTIVGYSPLVLPTKVEQFITVQSTTVEVDVEVEVEVEVLVVEVEVDVLVLVDVEVDVDVEVEVEVEVDVEVDVLVDVDVDVDVRVTFSHRAHKARALEVPLTSPMNGLGGLLGLGGPVNCTEKLVMFATVSNTKLSLPARNS